MSRLMAKIQDKLQLKGIITLHVHVDGEGNAESVTILGSKNADFDKIVGMAAVEEKYKPAVCGGKSCPMIYQYKASFSMK